MKHLIKLGERAAFASRQRCPHERERGSASIEAVIVLPAFLLFVSLIIAAGRVQLAHQSVDAAAAEAARAASIARTPHEAQAHATASGQQALANQGLACTRTEVVVDTSGFAVPVGIPAAVSATVVCEVDLAGVAIPGLPGTITIIGTMQSPLDTFRGR